jgi:hypothetical protein
LAAGDSGRLHAAASQQNKPDDRPGQGGEGATTPVCVRPSLTTEWGYAPHDPGERRKLQRTPDARMHHRTRAHTTENRGCRAAATTPAQVAVRSPCPVACYSPPTALDYLARLGRRRCPSGGRGGGRPGRAPSARTGPRRPPRFAARRATPSTPSPPPPTRPPARRRRRSGSGPGR